jgi:co-chaperonin GroES (HSP10)
MDCPIKPLWGNIILKRERLKTKGIIVPKSFEKRNAPTRGVLIAKGPGAAIELEEGRTYLFGQFAGTWLNADGTPGEDMDAEFYVCQDEELIGEVNV